MFANTFRISRSGAMIFFPGVGSMWQIYSFVKLYLLSNGYRGYIACSLILLNMLSVTVAKVTKSDKTMTSSL